MGVRIPTFADLGFDDPRATTGVPTLPQDNAVAQGMAAFGTGLQKAGQAAETVDAYGKMAQVKMQRALADANWFTSAAELDGNLKAENDPAKISALGDQYQARLQTAAAQISDPGARELWLAENQKHAMAGVKGAQLRNVGIYHDQYKAGVAEQGMNVVRVGAQADDPRGFDYAQQRINDLATAGQASGAMSAVDALSFRKNAEKQLVGGRAQHLVNSGDPNSALSFLDDHSTDIDPIMSEALRAKVKAKANAAEGEALANGALGLGPMPTPRAGAASAPSGGTIIPKDWTPGDYPNAPVESDQTISHPERNNPGNLRASDTNQWVGKTTKPGDAFESFDTPENGIRARAMTYGSYLRSGTNTIAQIADRSGPASDGNDIPSQIAAYKQALGGKYAAPGGENLPIEQTPENIRRLTAGGISIEAGGGGKWLPKGAGMAAIDQALGGMATEGGGVAAPKGLLAPGNIDIHNRPVVKNPDGTISTVASMSFNDGKGEVLIPRVAANGSGVLSQEDAIAQYRKTGQFLGRFDTPENATAYAESLHNAQDREYSAKPAAVDKLASFATGNAVPGGASPITDIHPEFASRISAMADAMPPDIKAKFAIISGYRSAERQAQVNPSVGNSHHTASGPGTGMAVDTVNDPDVLNWITQNGGKFGVGFPLADDPKEKNHLEPLDNGQRIPPAQMAQWSQAHGVATSGGDQVVGQPPPQPAAPAPGSPPNRTGLPPLSETWQRVWNTPGYSDEARAHAWQKATTRYNALEADAARAERIGTQQQKQVLEDRTNQVYADVYSGKPTITAQQIAVDPAFNSNPERRSQMIKLINDPPGSGVPANQSYAAALSLIDRIRRPEGDPFKITDVGPIYDAATNGQLNRTDFDFVKKEFNDARSPENETLNRLKDDLIKRYSPFINKSNPLHGDVDALGSAREYEYERYVASQIKAYRDAKKDPTALFNPKNADFLGGESVLRQFQPTMEESSQALGGIGADVVHPLRPIGLPEPPPIPPPFPTPAPPPTMRSDMPGATALPGGGVEFPIPPAGGIAPRKPGETPDQYMNRTGAR